MARFDPVRNSFVSGVLSPLLEGRDDLMQSRQAARQLVNMIVLPQGGVTRRPGTAFAGRVHAMNRKHRLIPFKYSVTNVYICEFGHHTLRFYVNGGLLKTGGDPVLLTTPYTEDDIFQLQWAQEGDVLYLVHPNFWPRKLTRTGPATFGLDEVVFSNQRAPLGPYNVNKSIYITANVAGSGADRRLTFSGAHGLTAAADIGRTFHVYRYRKSASVKFRAATFKIVGVPSTTQLDVDIGWEYEAGDAASISGADSYTWALGLFSATEGCNAVTFHEGRLFYGGFKRKPDYFVGSVSDDFDNFEMENVDPDIDDSFNADKAVARRTVSREVNEIRWLASTGQALLVGTSGAEFVVRGSTDGILTPDGTVVKPSTVRGSIRHTPAVIDGAVFFIQAGGRAIRRFGYDFEADQFSAVDVSLLSEHLFADGVEELVYHQTPYSTLWIRRKDGRIVGLTYERDQEILAAHLHEIGGPVESHTPAVVESLCVAPSAAGVDELWMVVRRQVGDELRRTVEYFGAPFRAGLPYEATRWERIGPLNWARFLDHHVVYENPIPIVDISAGSTTIVTTAVAHGLAPEQLVRLRGIGGWSGVGSERAPWGMAEVDNRTYRVLSVLSSTVFTIGTEEGLLDSREFSPFENPYGTAAAYVATTSVSGLSGVFGEEMVYVVADGGVSDPALVSGGVVALPAPAATIVLGYPYESVVETTRLAGGNPRGSDQGRPMSTPRVTLRLHETATGEIGRGPSPTRIEPLVMRIGHDPLDYPAPLFTGDKRVSIAGSWDDHPTIFVRAVDPLPMTILSITVEAIVGADA